MASEERFGYEWDKYSRLDDKYEMQFRNWISPLSERDFADKTVLDAGCGMGRNSYWPLRWGAKWVVAFDNDDRSIMRAKETLAEFKNAEVRKGNINDVNFVRQFDIVFSIGVVHHLRDPQRALANLFLQVAPGGKLLIWVYSYEGNEWIKRYIDPVRIRITSRLPLFLVHLLSYFASVPLWLFVKIFRGPSDYFKQLSTFKFWHIHSIVFDQLIPAVANYWTKEEVERLFDGPPIRSLDVHMPPNKCGWIAIAEK